MASGNPGFSWDKYSLRARNTNHEKREVIDILPAIFDGWTKSTDKQGCVVLKRSFTLGDEKLQNPYLKAKRNGDLEIYLNDELVKKVSGNFSEYCGLFIPKAAGETLHKGLNFIAVKAVNPSANLMIDFGVIDWRL